VIRNWTQRRLENLFQKYNKLYFNNSLKHWGVAIGQPEPEAVGLCDYEHKQLVVATDKQTDAESRATLLHEMAHAAAKTAGHGYKFWEQIEKLLKKSAPITLGFPEAPNNRTFVDIVPKRFRFCRKELEKLESARESKVHKETKNKGLQTQVIRDEEIILAFSEAFYDQPFASEEEIVSAVAQRFDLFDVEGKPKNRWAANIIRDGKNHYRQAKRDFHQEEMSEDAFQQSEKSVEAKQ